MSSSRDKKQATSYPIHRGVTGPPVWIGFLLFFALMSIPRFMTLLPHLPDYGINENEIVEAAIGMLGGDLDHRLHGYGPIFMYFLAAIYAFIAITRGISLEDYARGVFFEPTEFYLVARVLSAGLITVMIGVLLVQGRRLFGTRAALLGASLLSLPLIDNLVDFSVRVDVPQALFQTLALFAVLRIAEDDQLSDYIAAGVWSGLSFASKPMPGLLVLPMIVLVRWALVGSRHARRPQTISEPILERSRRFEPVILLMSRIRAVAFSWKLMFAIIAACLAGMIAYPYSILRFQDFWDFQLSTLRINTGGSWLSGYRLDRFISYFGWPICLLFVTATINALVRGDRKLRLLVAFPLFYCASFALFPTKIYHYPSITPALCMASGVLLDQLWVQSSWSRRLTTCILILGMAILALGPILRAWPRIDRALFVDDYTRVSATLAARRWIEESIPTGTGMFYFGWYPYGPRILHQDINRQARMGEYFMYGRMKNSFLKQRFAEAYSETVQTGRPTYNVHYRRMHPRPAARLDSLLSRHLASYCRRNGLRYIILAGMRLPHSELDLHWFGEVTRVGHFTDKMRGTNISIFEVSPDP